MYAYVEINKKNVVGLTIDLVLKCFFINLKLHKENGCFLLK